MSKSYKIKVNQGPGEAKFVDIPQAGASGKALAVKAVPGGKYQLLDAGTGYAPENIRASRSGKNLQVFFEGRSQPDLIIEDYYEVTPEGFNGLIGESESGRFYEYIPESATANSTVPLLADGSNLVGMALGGAEINASGAAVGALVAAPGLNPLLLAPLALLGGGGGGGGGGDNGGDTPNNNSAGIKITKATLDTGVSDSDFVTKGPVNEFSGTLSSFTGTPGDKVKLELLDKDGKPLDPVIEGTVTPTQVNGIWSWKWVPVDQDTATNLPEILKDGNYTLKATIVTAAGVAYTHATASTTQALDIDTSPNEGDNNHDVVLSITSVSADTGTLNNDWVTSDTALVFKGTLSKFSPALGDLVMLTLDPVAEGAANIVQYVTPIQKDNVWGWEWDAQTTPFPEGTYKLTATLVDKAGNPFTQQGAKAEEVLIIDVTGPEGDKGLSIESMSVDSGVGLATDSSRTDFKTNDNTPVFTGTLTDDLPEGEKIAIQLIKDGVVVESGFADVSGKEWTWTPNAPLADATYKLNAQVVDAAGNPASKVVNGDTTTIAPASKDVLIDTKGSTDPTDPNSKLKISTIGISNDTAANDVSNNDFVTSDGGNKDKSSDVNDDDKLTFNGTLSAGFTKNGGKVLVQIVDLDGEIKSSRYVEPTENKWTYEHIGALAEGQYVAKTILFDHVGNMISAKDQSFFIDVTPSENIYSTEMSTLGSEKITKFEFGNLVSIDGSNDSMVYTYGTYEFKGITGNYFGGNLNLSIEDGTVFEKGEFVMTFWDQAGNKTDIENAKQWVFSNANTASLTETSAGAALPKDFKGGQLIDSVGAHNVPVNFDMATLYDGIDTLANPEKAVTNHVVLSKDSGVTLDVSMGDVLALGVTNSFSIASVNGGAQHKDQIQMRIDGQSDDTLNLDGLVNGLNMTWEKSSTLFKLNNGPEEYDVYTNTVLGVALFVDDDIKVINIL
ncbi:Ig-like domain-containing protein [Limnohabitans sp. Bal53]|uniref:Ig-like domain-containing protein n=1 Tax=Limnohabitans sp. Bal53 TaxID=1977910 RepID=UPI000D372422|nr:Ig-like domain-containing protein [Limnohabitans sp. Bal53]PUE41819.1 hypothetical protein B9Z50_09170 [Limnohabitans sp. Bal53]